MLDVSKRKKIKKKRKIKKVKKDTLILTAFKYNYYVAAAYLSLCLKIPDVDFITADNIIETLKKYEDSDYNNIYIVAVRLKPDYIDDVIKIVEKMEQKKKTIKMYILKTRVNISNNKIEKLKNILEIADDIDKNENLIDIISKAFKIHDEEYNRFYEMYKFLEKRSEEPFNSKNLYEVLEEKNSEIADLCRYIEYMNSMFFKWREHKEEDLKEMITKIALNNLTEEEKKIARNYEYNNNIHLSGKSPAIKAVREKIFKVADTNASVLIYGETGVGKEVVARLIHEKSGRPGNFIAINCSAIPENLLESELFGYKKGAFTGAVNDKIGIFVAADKGTVFLDEIGDMSLSLQAKLLRVLENFEVIPLGDTNPVKVDVRVISATNKNLKHMIKKGEFREDLYHRILGMRIEIPPLRERKDDIENLLIEFLYKLHVRDKKPRYIYSKKDLEVLKQYDWPGNIREFEKCVYRVVSLGISFEEAIREMKEEAVNYYECEEDTNINRVVPLKEIEKREIIKALKIYNNKKKAADALGIVVNTLKNKIKKYNIKI